MLRVALLLACSSRGTPFAVDRIAEIHPGTTPRAEIASWFGDPAGVESSGTGFSSWRYLHEERSERDTAAASRVLVWAASLFGVYAPFGARAPVNVATGLATRHELEVFLGADGLVHDYRYEREEISDRRVC